MLFISVINSLINTFSEYDFQALQQIIMMSFILKYSGHISQLATTCIDN